MLDNVIFKLNSNSINGFSFAGDQFRWKAPNKIEASVVALVGRVITFSKLPKPCPPIIPLLLPRVHLTVHGILQRSCDHAWPPCEAPRRPARTAACGPVCTRWVYPRLLHHGNNMHTQRVSHTRRTKRRKRRRKCSARHNALQRSKDSRARHACVGHVSRRINEGRAPLLFVSLSSFLSAKICCESVGTLREDRPRLSVVTPPHHPPRKYSFRGFPFGLCSLQIVVGSLFMKISLRVKLCVI